MPHHSWFHRPPSRVLWFFLGAMTASCWMAHKRSDRPFAKSYCKRPPPESFSLPSTLSAQRNQTPDSYTWPRSICEIPRAINNLPAAPSPLYPDTDTRRHIPELDDVRKNPTYTQRQEQQWEKEKAHFAKVTRQATDTFFELSETVLSTVANATECWRAKLAQHRIEREKERVSTLSRDKIDPAPTATLSSSSSSSP